MPLEIVTVPCRKDNYAFIVHDPDTGETAVVDVPEAAPIEAELDARDWRLDDILLTHHHDDHIAGVEELRELYPGVRVTGAAADAHRLPPLDRAVSEGDSVTIGAEAGEVLDVSGHTVGHLAFHFPASQLAFTGDSLMAFGCGRVFEGTFAMMWESLQKLAALPDDTILCSGHEYTEANAAFAITIEPDNPALVARKAQIEAERAKGQFTVPSTLSVEKATNPFLRANTPEVKRALDMEASDSTEVFAEIRKRKDAF
ncbi:hydroxyacylglutathione hydrolase [Alkalilacustris brevis]|uniref:hydroxyacylglutathione hydrolase n=1 Tax=Alkalilacustris brevis TaxID=2026338 RepID=UPI000E0DC840|nr:hydroxyacylglutathione hydrolase [Alkalilacustris brevis]